jgi:Domain of unknown function (DUF4815)
MPIKTDLSVSPYFDDYTDSKDYYKILFRPGVAVQTRELNQLQSILQNQIEKFGDNVFKRGTIIDGCDITFQSSYPYVKLKDNQTDGAPVNVLEYIGYYVKNEANLVPLIAAVQTVVDGYESRSPDLKTLYLRYLNSGYANVAGVSTEEQTFAANQTLTVYNPDSVIEKVTSFNDSSGFSNTDSVVFLSSIAIQNSTGGTTFTNGFFAQDYVNDGTANVQIVSVDTTTNTEVVILRIKPRAIDLKAANADLWTLSVNTNIQSTNATPSDVARIVDIYGSGASAILRTGGAGEVDSITITNKGTGYKELPTVWVASPGATTTQIALANLVPQTYLTKITVANSALSPVGSGYAMTVGQGVIYQKGYFTRVNEHLVIVDKYANTPDALSVGFDTSETIINSNQDQTLLDNATGEPNATAPGANRLKLTPTLVVKSKAEADANTDFLSIAEFSGGNPYKQNRQTVYNKIGNEIARRTFEESGNYVIDQFLLNTDAANTISNEQSNFKVVIDPGIAYVNGKRIETVAYFEKAVNKGTDTIVANNVNVSLNYGNYIRIKELGGIFKFNIGDLVSLYPTAAAYLSSGGVGTTPSTGSLGTSLGTARIRSLVHESGVPGTPDCVYRLYLFDIQLATARNFSLIRSIFYNGTNKGIADAVLEGGEAVLKDSNLTSLLYYAGRPAVKTGNNFSYIYRTINDSGDLKLATNGIITFSASGTETFPYTAGATLSAAEENDIIITPLANVEVTANAAGSVSCNGTSTQVNGTSTTFTSSYEAGDFIKIANTTANAVYQISRVANDTVLFLTTNASAFTGANTKLFFPKNAPISLLRSSRSANVDINANTIIVNMGNTVNVETSIAIAYNVRSSNTTPVAKTVNRDRFVRLRLANNAASTQGPWVIGVPDVFRLKNVYLGPNATFTDSDTVSVSDVTTSFYIDHNQTVDYYGISYLYVKPGANVALTSSDFLLVKFDHFTSSGEGLKAPGAGGTYTINDGITLASSTTSINTLEIPEVFSTQGSYYDLRDQFDFRPQSANTVVANTVAANAPLNPEEPTTSGRFSSTDKKFPAPSSTLTGSLEYYVARVDRVVVDENNVFHVIKGTPDTGIPPQSPDDALTINILNIPPYPSHPNRMSAQTALFADTGVANEKYTNTRLKRYRVSTLVDKNQRQVLQPRGYTMVDIGALERRISDLEYYVTFTLAETLVQKKSIPSSSNTSVDRAKFGFFVDSFDSYKFSDLNNPGYNASIVDGYLSPRASEINLPLRPTTSPESLTLPYVEKPFLAQKEATDGPVVTTPVANTPVTPVANTPVTPIANTAANTTPPTVSNTDVGTIDTNTGTIVVTPVANTTAENTVVQITTSVQQSQKTTSRSDAGYVYEEFFYTFSATAGQAQFFINGRDNNLAAEIFQSQQADGSWNSILTSATASAITSADISQYGLSSLNDGRKIEHPGSLERKSYGPVGNWIEDHFKLSWTHNPSNGIYYKVRIYKGDKHGGFLQSSKAGTYGYQLRYPIDSVVNATLPINGFTPTVSWDIGWWGSFNIPTIDLAGLNYWGTDAFAYTPPTAQPAAVSNEQQFNVVITGLRPSTSHTFLFEGTDQTAKCKQAGGVLGAGLQTDANGVLDFVFYYNSDIESNTTLTSSLASTDMAAGTKNIEVVNADGTSSAEGTLQVRAYVKQIINDPAPAVEYIPPVDVTAVSSGVVASDVSYASTGGGGGRFIERGNVNWF